MNGQHGAQGFLSLWHCELLGGTKSRAWPIPRECARSKGPAARSGVEKDAIWSVLVVGLPGAKQCFHRLVSAWEEYTSHLGTFWHGFDPLIHARAQRLKWCGEGCYLVCLGGWSPWGDPVLP